MENIFGILSLQIEMRNGICLAMFHEESSHRRKTMDMTNRDDMGRNALDENLTAEGTRDELVSPEQAGTHDADGTMGRTAGTGAGAISGGVVGAAMGGPVGAAIGAVAGAVIGHGGGNAAHKIGDDHDDLNVETDSSGDLGRHTGAGAGSISGAVAGAAVGGPVGAVAGAVGGGMLGAAAGDASKHMGGDDADHAHHGAAHDTSYDTRGADLSPGNEIPGVQTGGYTTAGQDTRGITEKAADAFTGDRTDDKTGGHVFDTDRGMR
jgi:uncharacterized membrane protein